MSSSLQASVPDRAIPLLPLTEAQWPSWLSQQTAAARSWLERHEFSAVPGSFCVVPNAEGGVAFVAVGVSDPVSLWDLAALPYGLPQGVYVLQKITAGEALEKLALGWLLGARKLKTYKSAKGRPPAELACAEKIDVAALQRLAEVIGNTRDLIMTPAEDLSPEALAAAIVSVGKAQGAKISELKGEALLKKGFAAIHAVGRASVHPPRLIDLRWGHSKHPHLTLVGKGVCFDTGGLNLKPGNAMDLMKKDMAGAACALGVASLIMQTKMPICLRLLIPAVENAIGGNAFRPSDVIKMRGGLTVEIGNTDAEGRLVTGEALAEAASEKPDLVIDFTTFGPARAIFGPEMAALYTNDDRLAEGLLRAANEVEEGVWRMPLAAAYEPWLESAMADMTSAPDKPFGGSITSALFLQRLVGKTQPWVHLDFMAWNITSRPGRPQGAEAMTLRTVYRFLQEWARKG